MRARIGCLVFVVAFFASSQSVFADVMCSAPLTYSIRSLDSRFQISRADLVAVLAQSEAIWENPTNRDLFAYATTSGHINIDLIYDYRQARVDEHKLTTAKFDAIKTAYDALRRAMAIEASSTEIQIDQGEAEFAAYTSDLNRYNAEVLASNARGGATGSELQSFTDRATALRDRFAVLKEKERVLNDRITKFNAVNDLLNQIGTAVNAYVAIYRSRAASEKFQEGSYEQIGTRRTITMYEFPDRIKLVRGLAHEFGHALHMEHVPDSEAIMYQDNSGKEQVAKVADLAELTRVCGL